MPDIAQACLYCGQPTSGNFCQRCREYDSRPAVVIQGELGEQYAQEWREYIERLPAAL